MEPDRPKSDPSNRGDGTGLPLPRAPIGELLGFRVLEAANGRAAVTLEAGPQHANPMGTLHGGVLCDIADAAMGYAFASTLGPNEAFTTVELKINYFRPVWKAELKAQANVVQRGKSIGYVECEVSDEKGRLIAKSASTCMVLRESREPRAQASGDALPGEPPASSLSARARKLADSAGPAGLHPRLALRMARYCCLPFVSSMKAVSRLTSSSRKRVILKPAWSRRVGRLL